MAKKRSAPTASPLQSAQSEFAKAVERNDDVAIIETFGKVSAALLAAKLPVDEAKGHMDAAATTALGAVSDSRTRAAITAMQTHFGQFAAFATEMQSTPVAKTDTSSKPSMDAPKTT